MPKPDFSETLRNRGIRPSAQRVAIARCVLRAKTHPTADQVWKTVRRDFPYVSRATVYNTLKLFVEKGLLKHHWVDEAGSVFDPNTGRHHHFVDQETGMIVDIPWENLSVRGLDSLSGVEVTEYMVLVRGRKSGRSAARGRHKAIGNHHRRKEEEEP